MAEEPLEETYFEWLCAKVLKDAGSPNYKGLLEVLHKYEFVPQVVGDFNRAEDGLAVRQDFLLESHYGMNPDWDHIGCSFLEFLIGLTRKASWTTSSPAREWFWKLIENLNLDGFRRVTTDDYPDIEEVLYRVVWRVYDDNGNGGLFPLRMTPYDQTKVEVWYQFSEYVDENKLI